MKKLNSREIAFMLVGVIMGAGFASGRECWQFFGVFGELGYIGTIMFIIMFTLLACMLSYIAIHKKTSELGELVCPVDNKILKEIIAYVLALIYYTIIIVMSAAGGSLLEQQFGVNKYVGGAVIIALVVATVIGDFERISGVFRYIVPILFAVTITTIILVIIFDFPQSGAVSGYKPSELAPKWYISAVIYLAYNGTGTITMIGSTAMNAKDEKSAFIGSLAGALLLGLLTIIMLKAILTDMAYTASLSLPMLGYSSRINKILNIVYAVVLYGAIYSTATSEYYGFSTKIPNSRFKIPILIGAGVLGYFLGLTGFKTLVEYLYPIQGYIGIVYIILITINFVKTYVNNRKNNQHIQ